MVIKSIQSISDDCEIGSLLTPELCKQLVKSSLVGPAFLKSLVKLNGDSDLLANIDINTLQDKLNESAQSVEKLSSDERLRLLEIYSSLLDSGLMTSELENSLKAVLEVMLKTFDELERLATMSFML